jgi:hypothetical protein
VLLRILSLYCSFSGYSMYDGLLIYSVLFRVEGGGGYYAVACQCTSSFLSLAWWFEFACEHGFMSSEVKPIIIFRNLDNPSQAETPFLPHPCSTASTACDLRVAKLQQQPAMPSLQYNRSHVCNPPGISTLLCVCAHI